LPLSQVHRLAHGLKNSLFITAEIVELRASGPQNELSHARSHCRTNLSFLDLYSTYHQTGGVKVLQKACNLLSDDVEVVLQIAESNLNALNTVHLGPKRPFSAGECALLARLTGPCFAGQVAAAVSLVEAPYNNGKAAAVAKEVMVIKLRNKTGLSLESPFAGKHPKLIKKSTKAAAAEAAVTAAEANAVADFEEAKPLAAEFEAMDGGALTMALAQEAEPGDPFRECWLAHERLRVSGARSMNRAEILNGPHERCR
jgi:hypothetical protein